VAALEDLYAGLLHRRAFVEREDTGTRLAKPMRARGWLVERDVYMALRRPRDRAPAAGVARETDAATLHALDEATVREEPWARDDEIVGQVLGARALLGRAAPATRFFVAADDGVDASMATLYSDGTTAQLENVATLRDHRGRGLARAALSMAADAAVTMGHELVFIVADADDWPWRLYKRLGFDPVGWSWNVVRPGPEHPAHRRQPASMRRPPA
jgi:ribosomal protein S18 acetylase RimI-like enzyme